MPEKKKVFCKDCRFLTHKFLRHKAYKGPVCMNEACFEDDLLGPRSHRFTDWGFLNSGNKCKYFEPKKKWSIKLPTILLLIFCVGACVWVAKCFYIDTILAGGECIGWCGTPEPSGGGGTGDVREEEIVGGCGGTVEDFVEGG
jgi:hypothetical protein